MFKLFGKKESNSIHVNEIESLIGTVELIDIREPYEYKNGTLRTAKNIPMGILLANPQKYLLKEKTYYIMCQSGGRSRNACKTLEKLEYDVINVSGGMGSYVGTKRK